MWKKEHQRQITGKDDKKERRGRRESKSAAPKDETSTKVTLGKRDHKTATSHKTNTSTFKT